MSAAQHCSCSRRLVVDQDDVIQLISTLLYTVADFDWRDALNLEGRLTQDEKIVRYHRDHTLNHKWICV